MRKLIVGLVVVGLLAVGAPAMAQRADPLGLISSGAVLPYFGSGEGAIAPGSLSFLEVASPRSDNDGAHMFFFDASCHRQGQSVGLPLTTNDVEVLRVDDIGSGSPFAVPAQGLITLAQAASGGFTLRPLESPIHARVLWVNGAGDYIRILEPIALANFDGPGTEVWNPLRTAATFWAPPVTPGFLSTPIYFVCPPPDITSGVASDPVTGTPAFSSSPANPGGPFPELVPGAVGTTQLAFRIYDDEENFLRDVRNTCQCLTARNVTEISDIYEKAPNGTYTEVESQGPVSSFTGYRAISVSLGSQGLDGFGRLSNAARCSIVDDPENCIPESNGR